MMDFRKAAYQIILCFVLGLSLFGGQVIAQEANDNLANRSGEPLSTDCQNVRNAMAEEEGQIDDVSDMTLADSEEYWGCVVSIAGTTTLDKLFIAFLGDGAIKPIATVYSSFADGGYDERVAQLQSNKASLELSSPLAELLVTFNHLINQILVVLAGLFFVFYLINTAHDGSLFGERYSAYWKILRFAFVLVLMAPLESLDNFSTMQALVVVVAEVAILAASVIWMVISAADAMYGVDINNIIEEEKDVVYNSISETVDQNVFIHACDIQKRKSIMLGDIGASQMTQSTLDESKYNQCLYDDSFTEFEDSVRYKNTYNPIELVRTAKCAEDGYSNVDTAALCGNQSADSDWPSEILDEQLGQSYQSDVRDVSEKLIHLMCSNIKEDASSVEYKRTCAKYNTSFEYDNEGGIETYDVNNSADASEILNDLKSLKDRAYASLQGHAEQTAVEGLIGDIEERADRVIRNSFISAAGFIFENGKNYSKVKERYKKIFTDYKTFYSSPVEKSLTPDSQRLSYEGRTLTRDDDDEYIFLPEQYYQTPYIIENINKISSADEERKDLKDIMVENIFVGANMITDFNNSGDTGNLDEGCADDFGFCSVVSINPINDIVRTGVDIADATTGMTILFTGVEMVSNNIIEGAEISDSFTKGFFQLMYVINVASGILATVLFIQATIGYFMIYMLPLVIFVYFLGVVLNWIISVFEAIVIVNFWLLVHLLPSSEEGFAGQAKQGYTMLLHILVKPSFLILGLFVALMMSSIMVAFLNVSFGIVLSSFPIFQNPDSYIDFIYNMLIDLIYFVALLYVCFRAAKAIYKVPRSLISWLGFDESSHAGFSESFDEYKQQVIVNIKRYIIII